MSQTINESLKSLGIPLLLVMLISACGGGGSSDNSNSGGEGSASGASDGTDMNTGSNDSGPDDTGAGTGSGSSNNNQNFGQPSNSQIRPGVIVEAMGSQCTSNFIYSDSQGNFYIGAAAHCFSPDSNSGVDPCLARNEAIGIDVVIENADFVGSLAYSSWQTMRDKGETPGTEICQGNDFALIKIDARDIGNIHPAARVFGGPTALFEGNASIGDEVYTYGQSPLSLQQAKTGNIDGISDENWLYSVSLSSPGVPGDSGSAVLHESGKALGVLSTLDACIGICPLTSNSVVNLDMALTYANTNVFGANLNLVTWSNFSP
ncbi:MAG: trypsin-like peptidase domain-containing protein [Salinisphaeraceae bacterium]|nr:trypsin-like peptidase domain-containing protein [Salinisphaeraceae bacterium]